ncbi:MAG: hypothetical protein OEW18_13845, partial [Candidatus Aminicenantes bacterium]|nr:hypothetical protein [Candidatus Aminicenantes bacterium]
MSRRRRDFLKAAALSSCSWPAFLLPSQKHDECDEMLRQTRRRFQEGLAEERAILFRQLISRYGSGVLDLVRKVTIEDARRRLRESSLPKRDLEAVLEILWKPSAGLLDFRVEEKGPGLLKL